MPEGGVQSVHRAVGLLDALTAEGGEASLSVLVQRTGLPLATVHRLLATLSQRSLVRRIDGRRYALGPRLLNYGEAAQRAMSSWAIPELKQLSSSTAETANLAILSGDRVTYLAQSPSPHTMRTFTEVGRQVDPHCTGVGKALLSTLSDAEVSAMLSRHGMEAKTPNTIVTSTDMLTELAAIRQQGYAIDEGEQEVGVRCIAVALPTAVTRLAVSVSGPSARVTLERVGDLVPVVQAAALALAKMVDGRVPSVDPS